MRKIPFPIHPILLALYSVLYLYAYNLGKIDISSLIPPLILVVSLSCLVYVIITLVTRNIDRAALITSASLLFFFSYGHLYRLLVAKLASIRFIRSGTELTVYLLAIWAGALLTIVYFIIRAGRDPKPLTGILNIVSCILLSMPIVSIGAYEGTLRISLSKRASPIEISKIAPSVAKPGPYPDIYFIMPDAYANRAVLKNYYGYDNSEFLDGLRRKSFLIADRATSNYSQTLLSVASCFNMRYMDNDKDGLEEGSEDVRIVSDMVRNGRVIMFLRSLGYKVAAFSLGDRKSELYNADMYLEGVIKANTFMDLVINTTPLPVILDLIEGPDQHDLYRKKILHVFDKIPKISRDGSPLFVFAHIEAPHPPFVFDREGGKVKQDVYLSNIDGDHLIRNGGLSKAEYVKYYIDQLIFVNRRLDDLVGRILARPGREPIIIIQADHGPRSGMDWEDVSKSDASEVMAILGAYYLPGRAIGIYDTITPVNTFRIVFDEYFGTTYGLLEDKNYLSSARNPFRFFDVTRKVAAGS